MRTGAARAVAAVALLWAAVAGAHPQGFHKHVRVVVHPDRVEALVVMDVDAGRRSQLLRAGADANGDRKLDAAELARLRAKLAALAAGKLKVSFSGYLVKLGQVEAKLGLRDDPGTGETGLSVAVLLEVKLPRPVSEGMELVVEDAAPDRSHVKVEAEQVVDGGAGPYAQGELQPGERLRLSLAGARTL